MKAVICGMRKAMGLCFFIDAAKCVDCIPSLGGLSSLLRPRVLR